MVLTKFSKNLEGAFSIVERVQRIERLFPEFDSEMKKNVNFLPDALLFEIEDFTERNAITVIASHVESRKSCHKCCERCLKAHILKRCEDLDFGKKVLDKIEGIFDCESGHMGHYVDSEKLFKV